MVVHDGAARDRQRAAGQAASGQTQRAHPRRHCHRSRGRGRPRHGDRGADTGPCGARVAVPDGPGSVAPDRMGAVGPYRGRRRRRIPRLALAGAVVAAVAATEIAGVIPVPWWHGQAPSAAYAVTKNPDGTVDVTVRWNQLHDPDALNARLRQAGVRAAVMLYSAPRRCRATVALDPTYSTLHVDLRQHPELAKHPRALVAYLRSQDLGSNMIASALAIPTMSRCSRSTPTRSRAVTSSWSSRDGCARRVPRPKRWNCAR